MFDAQTQLVNIIVLCNETTALLHNELLCYHAGRTHGGERSDAVCRVDHASPVGIRGARPAGVFWLSGEEILHRNVEIFAVGKIAEFARFAGGERRKSPDRFSIPSGASNDSEEDWRSGVVQRSGTEAE